MLLPLHHFITYSIVIREKLNQLGFTWELPSHARKRRKASDEAEALKADGLTDEPSPLEWKAPKVRDDAPAALPSKWPDEVRIQLRLCGVTDMHAFRVVINDGSFNNRMTGLA
jgi:hypothetical protein